MSRYVWWRRKKDINDWACTCMDCQRTKVGHHTSAPVGKMSLPVAHLQHLHDLVGLLPMSQGFQYVLTVVDCFTCWLSWWLSPTSLQRHVPACSLWFACFDIPCNIVSDHGHQFTSKLWERFASLLGVKLSTITAYHRQSICMVERFHWQLEASLSVRLRLVESDWLAMLMLTRTAPKEDLKVSPTDLVYGSALALPAAPLPPTVDFPPQLQQQMSQLHTLLPVRHGSRIVFPPSLDMVKFVCLHEEVHQASLRPLA